MWVSMLFLLSVGIVLPKGKVAEGFWQPDIHWQVFPTVWVPLHSMHYFGSVLITSSSSVVGKNWTDYLVPQMKMKSTSDLSKNKEFNVSPTQKWIWRWGPKSQEVGEREPIWRSTVVTRMIAALRWAVIWLNLMFHKLCWAKSQRQCPLTTNLCRRMWAEAESRTKVRPLTSLVFYH